MTKISTPDHLTEDQITQFKESGYIACADILTAKQIERARVALHRIARELSANASSKYSPPRSGGGNQSGASFRRANSSSMIQLEPGFEPEGKSQEEITNHVRKFWAFCDEDTVFQEMISAGSRLHGMVETLLGRDPILFQEMALVKPALVGSAKPWHQDNAYFTVEPLDAILGVWIALDDATPENGCMHVIPGGHRHGAHKHHHGVDCEIDPQLLEVSRGIAIPIPAGGALLFYSMLPHETPPNHSPHHRRALQFHFRGANTRIVDEETYDRLFVDRSGVAASCRAASRLGF